MITALLSFFDEYPDDLIDCIGALGMVGVDRLVAVDGPYELYPYDKVRSSERSLNAIRSACKASKISLTLSVRGHAWRGNEVEKRNHMFNLARGARPRGKWQVERKERNWLLVVDTDHIWQSDRDLHALLEDKITGAPENASFAQVSFAEVFQPDGTPIYALARPLMRARWDLALVGNHYTYEIEDGEKFSTFLDRPKSTAPAFDLSDRVRVIHRVYERDARKREKQAIYYEHRDGQGVERV